MIQALQAEIRAHWAAYRSHSYKVEELERRQQLCVSRRKHASAYLYPVQLPKDEPAPAPLPAQSAPERKPSVQSGELPVIERAAPAVNSSQQKPGFFKRHLGKWIGGASGAFIGAGIGALAGFFLAPVSFGLSVPLFAAIGAVVGGAVIGGGLGAAVGAIIDHCTSGNRKSAKADIENGLLKPDASDRPANKKEARKDSTNNAALHAALLEGTPRQVVAPVVPPEIDRQQQQVQSSAPHVDSAPAYTVEELAKAQKELGDIVDGLDGLDSLVRGGNPRPATANRSI
jgi:hypothetical protein